MAGTELQTIKSQWGGESSKWSQDKKLLSLNPQFRIKVKTLLQKLKKRGFQPTIFYGWRSQEVQLQLYARKRSKIKFSFHNATYKNGTPNALATDIIDSRYLCSSRNETKEFWQALGEEANKLDLTWGGSWVSFKDFAHVQMFSNLKLATIKNESSQ